MKARGLRRRRVWLVAVLLVAAWRLDAQDDLTFDLIIRGGRIVDGTGYPWFSADLGVRGDRIATIGDLAAASAPHVIAADGLVVAPGFIDPHTHARRGIARVPTADNALLQGVTTLTEGNDGSSPFPIGEHLRQMTELAISPNWAVYVGQGTIRSRIVGDEDRTATPAELSEMSALVDQAMAEGALGGCRANPQPRHVRGSAPVRGGGDTRLGQRRPRG